MLNYGLSLVDFYFIEPVESFFAIYFLISIQYYLFYHRRCCENWLITTFIDNILEQNIQKKITQSSSTFIFVYKIDKHYHQKKK